MLLPEPLVVIALPIESQDVFERARIPVLYSGVGKINAAWALTRKLAEYRHRGQPLPRVINFGTSGSRRLPTHSLVGCTSFVQHDMDVSGLGFAQGTTPFDEIPSRIEFPSVFSDLPNVTCGSGDCFVTGTPGIECDVLDMEAYALAKVCKLEGAPFGCVKYVTDGADHAAAEDWQKNLHRAAELFLRCYQRLLATA